MHLPRMAALGALLLAGCGMKHSGAPVVSLTYAWSRATVAGQTTAAAYVTITNSGNGEDRLTRVSTPIGMASLHSTSMTGGVMRMRPVPVLRIPAHSKVELKPGGMHIMIMGLKQPLRAGAAFPLTFAFDRSPGRTVSVEVRPATSDGAGM